MKPHEFLDDDTRDELAQHVLGTLSPAQSRTLALHVTRCEVCRREIDELHAVVGALGVLGPRREPKPGTWTRVLERIHAKSPAGGAAEGEPSPFHRVLDHVADGALLRSVLVRAGEEPWRSTGVPGIEMRTLHVDRANNRATILARMAPGATYPAHVHGGPEECFVLEGDLWEGDRRMSAGDYERAPEGSRHEVQSTRGGCLLLLVSSLSDRAV
ncbi:MAG TPA: cupin domain-containing protein [Candidatus Bathyarchaeia archaeon]|nr:cupin domain-containing protein [Candidatus Bathyarchaeia archaeon]